MNFNKQENGTEGGQNVPIKDPVARDLYSNGTMPLWNQHLELSLLALHDTHLGTLLYISVYKSEALEAHYEFRRFPTIRID